MLDYSSGGSSSNSMKTTSQRNCAHHTALLLLMPLYAPPTHLLKVMLVLMPSEAAYTACAFACEALSECLLVWPLPWLPGFPPAT
jgi:hypothetical protein